MLNGQAAPMVARLAKGEWDMTGYVFMFEGIFYSPDGKVDMTDAQVEAHNAELKQA